MGTAWAACSGESHAEPEADPAPSESGLCTEARAIEAASGVTRQYCSGTNGCDFNARLEERESGGKDGTEASAVWIVIVSLIHSFDEAGQPRFLPDGARIVRVSTDCAPLSVSGHGGPIPMPDR